MKKAFVLFLCLVLAVLSLTSCGSSNGYTMFNSAYVDDGYAYEAEAPMAAGDGFSTYAADMEEAEFVEYDEDVNVEAVSETARKIVYSSWYSISTTTYDETVEALKALCDKYGAYFETSSSYGSYDSTSRSSSYTVRVPVKNYFAFIGEAGSIGTVTSSGENNRDVTEQYFDTTARLDSATLREERLLEILANADTLDDVLTLERELADVRYEIESYTGTLRKLDSLVSYATAEINISEVRRVEPVVTEKTPLGERIATGFSVGFAGLKDDLADFLVDLSFDAPYLLLVWLPIIAVIVVVILLIRRGARRRKAKRIAAYQASLTAQQAPAQEQENDDK